MMVSRAHDALPEVLYLTLLSWLIGLSTAAWGLATVHRGAALSPVPHPFFAAFLCGLLVGAALLRMLSDALEELSRVRRPDHVLLTCVSATVLLALMETCLLTPAQKASFEAAARSPPAGRASANERSSLLFPPSPSAPLHSAAAAPPWRHFPLSCAVLFAARVLLGGISLSAGATGYVATALSLPLTCCSLQDVSRLVGACRSLGQARRSQSFAVVCLALVFPCGTMIACALFWQDQSSKWSEKVHMWRVVIAGVLIYLALFLLAPAHSHARSVNTAYLFAFGVGLSVITVVEKLSR
ncbi:hypothetical protein AB1Y20_015300 [Prymnesium parvum]|uniref:Uncharacterized protein n=1 Tax=Prymnesium parvum TaxID=97485 RepID=A0AB34JY39_PRYPA